LESRGYVCEDVGEPVQDHSNAILNAISMGMLAKEGAPVSDDIRLAATRALANR
jgi:hypothetical protein